MPQLLIDTHAHIYLSDFQSDIAEIVQRSIENGVEKIVLPNIDNTSIEDVFLLVHSYPQMCYPAVGLHPCSVNASYIDELNKLQKYLADPRVVAIGETGIDLYWDKTFLTEQISSFTTQIQWAHQLKKPIIIHVRDSFEETFETMDAAYSPGLTGVFHCFTGNEEQARKALSFDGFYLGIGGVLTYKNSNLREVLKMIPTDRIVLETDSPYLPPVPHRGKRNEPSYVVHVLQAVAEALEIPVDELADITTANAKKLFNL